jgi:hypothetical protein
MLKIAYRILTPEVEDFFAQIFILCINNIKCEWQMQCRKPAENKMPHIQLHLAGRNYANNQSCDGTYPIGILECIGQAAGYT